MLRIVGGRLSGRRFRGPGKNTRPTAERVREAMFSALEARSVVRGARVLDLFSGTGALAFEASSRGAREALCVDRERKCLGAIRGDAKALGLDAITVLSVDLLSPPRTVVGRLAGRGPFDLLFADPPYAEAAAVPALLIALSDAGLIAEDALLVFEHATRDTPEVPDALAKVASYRYGDTTVDFLTPAAPENP